MEHQSKLGIMPRNDITIPMISKILTENYENIYTTNIAKVLLNKQANDIVSKVDKKGNR